ncbi:sulfotransferase family 2 domain-containing protein [Sulfitobacter sp. JB4-11]|uniref:sulfotransferase family 2 domain-containing protein n=1 Tax=Sulfitobacter rhodophyticola TaxID=3238304 RepID=UPI003511559E
MILSTGRRYLFIHIPKTGGTSLALALEERAMKDDIMLGDTPKARKRRRRVADASTVGRLWKHSTRADIEGLVSAEVLAGLFTFTLVRNPWDRAVSYYHWLKDQVFDHPSVAAAKRLPFDGFLAEERVQASLRDWPAARYLRDGQGQACGDLFIRLEHFAEDAIPFFDHLGFEVTLPKVNQSARADGYAQYYNADLRDLVADCCAEDIARFGYSFD